jgi:hypothetical protein
MIELKYILDGTTHRTSLASNCRTHFTKAKFGALRCCAVNRSAMQCRKCNLTKK